MTTQQYREWYQKELVAKTYHPLIHLSFNFGILLLLIIGHFSMVQSWGLATMVILFTVFIFGNIVVWGLHRYPLHRHYRWWSFPYKAHTIQHHRYFTSEHITYDGLRDYVAIFFPVGVVAGFALLAQPLFFFSARFLVGSDLAHVFCAGCAGYFLLYESFHWASHLSLEHPLMKISWIRYMRGHHLIHHDPKLMGQYNFCIVYPMMDFIMGTKYKGNLHEIPPHNVESK